MSSNDKAGVMALAAILAVLLGVVPVFFGVFAVLIGIMQFVQTGSFLSGHLPALLLVVMGAISLAAGIYIARWGLRVQRTVQNTP